MFGEETEKTEFEPLPDGDYNVTFDDCQIDESGTHPRITATYTVLDGAFKNRKLWQRFFFTDGTAPKMMPWQMSILGIKDEISAANCQSHAETARVALDKMGDVIGCSYRVQVSTREYNGKYYNDAILQSNEIVPEMQVDTASTASVSGTAPPPTFNENEEINF